MLKNIFKTDRTKVDDFRKDRKRQSDDDFLNACRIQDEKERIIAVAVRRAIANVGMIDSQFIYADDRWPEEIGILPLWDSMDSLEFIMELERELGIDIIEGDFQWNYAHFVVKDLVKQIHSNLKDKLKA